MIRSLHLNIRPDVQIYSHCDVNFIKIQLPGSIRLNHGLKQSHRISFSIFLSTWAFARQHCPFLKLIRAGTDQSIGFKLNCELISKYISTMSACAKSSGPEPSGNPGDPRTVKSRVLETGAAMLQEFKPIKQICAHLNAFHVYANDPTRCVEANHYCTHLTEGMSAPGEKNLRPGEKKLTESHLASRPPPMFNLRLAQDQCPAHWR